MVCICGNEEFYAHQIVHMDIVVDKDNCFVKNLEDGIYDSEIPYGPYTCTKCGREYDELCD